MPGLPFIKGITREAEVPTRLRNVPRHHAGFMQQLQSPGYHSVLFGLGHGPLLLDREGSQNVTLVLGLHTTVSITPSHANRYGGAGIEISPWWTDCAAAEPAAHRCIPLAASSHRLVNRSVPGCRIHCVGRLRIHRKTGDIQVVDPEIDREPGFPGVGALEHP